MTIRSDEVSDALLRLRDEFETDPLEEPEKAVSIVADLIASPQNDTTADVLALRSLLGVLNEANGDSSVTREQLVSRSVTDKAARSQISRVLDSLESHFDLPLSKPPTNDNTRLLMGIGAAVIVLAAIVVISVFAFDDDATPGASATPTTASSGQPTTTTQAPSTTETASSAGEGVLAEFPAVREGRFTVERGWRVTPGDQQLIGLVRLTPANATASGIHRELAPPMPISNASSIEWDPVPDAIANHVASYNVNLEERGSFLIEFRVPLNPEEAIAEIDVLNWFEDWLPQAEDLRSVLGDSDEILEPVLSSGS